MVHRLFLLIGLIFCAFVCYAQIERVDTLEFEHKLNGDTVMLKTHSGIPFVKDTVSDYCELSFRYNPVVDPLFNYRMVQSQELNVPGLSFVLGQAPIFSWSTGEVIAEGGRAVYPGLMQIDSGSIGLYQRVGSFNLYAGGIVNKYGYFRGLHTQYGLNGSITYSFSPKVSFTAFGTYYFGKPPIMGGSLPMPPAMVNYYGVSKFGGYINYDAGERAGVLVGGQIVQQVGTHQYEPEPIVTPYFKVGNSKRKIAIGLPVGQILHGILRR